MTYRCTCCHRRFASSFEAASHECPGSLWELVETFGALLAAVGIGLAIGWVTGIVR